MAISTKTSVNALSVADTAFSFIVPLAVTFTTYFSVETATVVAGRLIGVVLSIIIAFSWAGSMKKKIKLRRDQGFPPQPYKVLFANSVMPLTALIGITALLYNLQGDIQELARVMTVISASEIMGFGMKTWKTHFDMKLVVESKTPPSSII
jgi:hypothetical protein